MNALLALFRSRKFLVFLFTVAADAVTSFVADPHVVTELITAISAVGAVLIGSIAHEDGKKADAGLVPPEAEPATPAQPAPRIGVMLSILLTAGILLGGCAATPQSRWAQARDTLTVTQNAILAQHRAGTISDADLVALDDSVKAARSALKAADQQTPGGDSFDYWLDLTEALLQRLAERKLGPAHPARTLPPTLKPEASHGRVPTDSRRDPHRPLDARLGASPGSAQQAGWRVHARAA